MIRITRKLRFIDISSAYKIYVGGVCRGKIRAGGTKEFALEKGNYTISARTGLFEEYGSNPLHIKIRDSSDIVDLEVGIALTGWRRELFPYLVGFFFKKDEYLFVREKQDVEEIE